MTLPWEALLSSPVITARGRYGHAVKTGDPDLIQTGQRDLAAAKLEQYIARVVSEAPPLTPTQIDRLAALLKAPAPAKTLRRPVTVDEALIAAGDSR